MNRFILSFASHAARLLPMRVKLSLYRIPLLASLIRKGLNRAAPEGLVTVEVAGGTLAGIRLNLDLQTEKDYWLGTYEPELQAAVLEWVKPGMVVYDVGANIGYTSLLLARATGPRGKVFAFEALPENLERLSANLILNEMTGRVSVISGAVVDREGPVRFLAGPSGGMGKVEGAAGRKGIGYRAAITVRGIALDDFVYRQGNPAPQAIKMDIEGGEILALLGMAQLLHLARPLILLELHGEECTKAAWERLSTAGYRICRMAPGYPELRSWEALGWKAYILAHPDAALRPRLDETVRKVNEANGERAGQSARN